MSDAPGDGGPILDLRPAGPTAPLRGELLGRTLREWRADTAAELGLPAGLLVASGHQPEWWHPGILAKFLWAQAIADRARAAVAWLLVDTDLRDPMELRYPVVDRGELRAAVHRFGPRPVAGSTPAGRGACVPAPVESAGAGPEPALPCVREGLGRAHDALLRHADAPDCAAQAARALASSLPGLREPAAIVRTSQVLRTALGAALLDRAADDPDACVRAFNDAVRAVPRVARPLAEAGARGPELPFWTADAHGVRRAVLAAELGALRDRGAPLWPRAFLTSLVARAALCDRFVHGTGAATYERATERFAHAWLGAELPPFDIASATLRLPFPPEAGPPPVDAAARRRRWFDPAASGAEPSEEKRAALAEIAALPRRSAARRERWLGMHAAIAAARRAHACDLAELEALAHADRSRARSAALRADRTWPAVLHPPESISLLAESIRLHAR